MAGIGLKWHLNNKFGRFVRSASKINVLYLHINTSEFKAVWNSTWNYSFWIDQKVESANLPKKLQQNGTFITSTDVGFIARLLQTPFALVNTCSTVQKFFFFCHFIIVVISKNSWFLWLLSLWYVFKVTGRVCVFIGTVRRFLEHHGNSIETVVFAVSNTEEVCMTW